MEDEIKYAALNIAKIIKYNMYLLDRPEEMALSIECHLRNAMNKAFEAGKNSCVVSDYTCLNLQTNTIKN